MNETKYVSKATTKPYKQKFNNLFKKIQIKFKDDFSLSYRLVGSSARNLVIEHHNKGFDLDYQIIIHKIRNQTKWKKPKEIKDAFFSFIQKELKNEYKIENSTSAITLKKIDNIKNKIKQGYDITIFKNYNPVSDLEILKREFDNPNSYIFQKLKSYDDYNNNLRLIKDKKLWSQLRELYLKNKIQNEKNITKENSYIIFMKTVKTIADRY